MKPKIDESKSLKKKCFCMLILMVKCYKSEKPIRKIKMNK